MRDSLKKVASLFLAAGLLGLVPAAPGWAQQRVPGHERCRAITTAEVRALFDHWNAALASGDAASVAALYAPDAILLPTVENGPLTGTASIKAYFVGFLKKHPRGTIVSRSVHVGCNLAYDVGTYSFALDGATPGSREQVRARFTYIYAPYGSRWLIAHHHSSAMPQPAP